MAYAVVTGLLVDAPEHRIHHLHVCLDSQLIITQLNDVYHVLNPCLYHKLVGLDWTLLN